MDKLFSQLLEEITPHVNPLVMNGYAILCMKKVEEYVDRVFRSASGSFPPGLVYVDYERCTPYEEFLEITKSQNNKRTYDLAKSDLYLVKYRFRFEGEDLPPRYIYLPYVNEAGIIHLRGVKYHITPVLSDKVISPGFDSVFVRLLRNKMIFKRCCHTIIINGRRETTHVIWSNIHRKVKDNKKVPMTTKAESIIVHYLFAKFGVSETFNKYCGFKPTIGGEEINEDNYPPTKWVICESSQVRPKTFIQELYTPTLIKLVIPIEYWNTLSKAIVAGFFYIVDHFPLRFKIGFLESTNLWKIILGHILFSGSYGENKLYSDICEHYESIDNYVDSIVIEKLKESGYNINNFYDLLSLILTEFNNLILDNENTALSMFGKSLEVLYYVLYEITSGIFNVNFKLNTFITKRPLTMKDVREIFNKNLKMRAMHKLSSGKIVIETVSYSGDHKYPKLTSKLTEQESLPGGTRGKSVRFSLGQTKHLDISMVEAGSILFLSKSNPTPTNRINPFICIDISTGTIYPDPRFNDIRTKTHNLLKGIEK